MKAVILTVIRHIISKEKEGQYYTLPFDVPDGVVKITVTYDYYKPTKGMMGDIRPSNTVDIGLMDEKGNFLGWSGSAHKTIYVGQYDSSAGYLCQKINPGAWSIIIGAYHVMDKGVEVTYTIDFEYGGEVLLFDDLVSNPWSTDRIKDYDTLRKYYLDAVDNCVDGVTEIFLHPALPNDSYGKQWQKRDFEYRLLKSGDLLQRAEDKGIKVTGWDVFGK